ncbi:MAG TPA: FtsW/RodA/SpoVE family cell cycle protein [Acidimicrobiia bacterium]|jgi:rod shape determining protein RodA
MILDQQLPTVVTPRPPRAVGLRNSPLARVDWLLVFAAAGISVLGLLMVYSSTHAHVFPNGAVIGSYYVKRQALALLVGLAACGLAMAFDYTRLRELWPLLYGLTLPLLLAVRFVGQGRGGTTAWFNVGPFQFQPSELAKLVLIVSIAGYCHQHVGELDAWRLGVAVVLAGIPMALVFAQGDLGSMLVMGVCTVAVLVVAGLRPSHLVVLLLISVSVLGALVVSHSFETYRLDRLTAFVNQNPSARAVDLNNAQYTLRESKAAIQHGGLEGQGYDEGQLTQLSFVPEQHTDFIFTAVGEELGFVGGAVLLGLFALLAWRIWRIAAGTADLFGSLICIGLVALFAFQVFENMGMTMGMMPITGIPLPFMSYGGSAMIAYWASVGLVLGIHFRR